MNEETFISMVELQTPSDTPGSAGARLSQLHLGTASAVTERNQDEFEGIAARWNRGELTSAFLAELGVWLTGHPELGFYWATVKEELGKLPSGDADGDVVRRLYASLGCAGTEATLVAAYFGWPSLDGSSPARTPTVLHSRGTHRYFRPAFRDDCWGEAVNLTTCECGVREAVLPDLPWRVEFPSPHRVGTLPRQTANLTGSSWVSLLCASAHELAVFTRRSRSCGP